MKKMMKMCCAAALLALCGCVSFEYEGNRDPNPTSDVQVYTDATRIDRPYQVLGRASASGSYLDVSREKLQAKLVSEARKHGADAILITEQQVVSDGVQRNAPLFESAFDYDDTSRSWRQIYKDVDLNYGSVRGTPPDTTTLTSYRRILRAEFLKYSPQTTPEADRP